MKINIHQCILRWHLSPWYSDAHVHLQVNLLKVPPFKQTADGQLVVGVTNVVV